MLKHILCLLFISLNISFAMTNEQIDEFISKNSVDIQTLNGVPNKVYASNPPLLFLLYAVAPEKVSGINSSFGKREKPYLKESMINQPVVGGFFGQGKIPNMEMLLKLDPDLILVNSDSKNTQKKFKETLGGINKPMLYLKGYELEDYIDSLEVLGKILDKQDRVKKLIEYSKKTMDISKELNEYIVKNSVVKPKIYYAEDPDGLATECEGSWHTRLIELSGAENVHKCSGNPDATAYGHIKIRFEHVAEYYPYIILIFEKSFYDKIYDDPKWQILKAVKNKRAYYLPREPFSWFDRPPSFMRFIGLKWLINLTHPDVFKFNMNKEVKDFYKLLLEVDVSDNQVKELIGE